MMGSRLVTEMTALEARAFFKKSGSYVNFELPPYVSFDELITVSSSYIGNKQISDFCKKDSKNDKPLYPARFESVNYTILSNKDGAYSWRPLQIIHPFLYVEFVNLLTTEDNWQKLHNRLSDYSESCVECISIPRESLDGESDRAWQITNWWEFIEQETLKEAFKFNYLATTDITDCYGSIYTHAFEWALDEGGREGAKNRKRKNERSSGLGAQIDARLQNLNNGQTNGIPQGSVLMDFLAEIVLGYADTLLTERIATKQWQWKGRSFRILRYRDDYRILADSPLTGNEILKQIDLVLYELGLKMSPSKTKTSTDIITSAIKPEKMESIFMAPAYLHFQKRAMRIFQLSQKYPNTGIVSKELGAFYDDFVRPKRLKNINYEVLVSIFVMIAVNSPRVVHLVSGIISKIFERMDDIDRVIGITKQINKKFESIPNAGLLDIWLQRISAPLGIDSAYNDLFTKVAVKGVENTVLWNNDWVLDDGLAFINSVDISTLKEKLESETISYVVEREEFELYRLVDY